MNLIEDWKRERKIRSVLRGLARQRVVLVREPDDVWVLEDQVTLRTCYMRGWVEPLRNATAKGTLRPEGSYRLPASAAPIVYYRLTDSGWAVINRSQQLVILGLFLAFMALLAA